MRVSAAELAAGEMAAVGPAVCRRLPWQVVRVHDDGSATVAVRPRWSSGVSSPPVVSSPVPVEIVDHRIVYVRGPLNRRYRCKGCTWEGSLPAEHP